VSKPSSISPHWLEIFDNPRMDLGLSGLAVHFDSFEDG
jgi:hypothetical protein